jgi:hypothetical protein
MFYGKIDFNGTTEVELQEALLRCKNELEAHSYTGKFVITVVEEKENGEFVEIPNFV